EAAATHQSGSRPFEHFICDKPQITCDKRIVIDLKAELKRRNLDIGVLWRDMKRVQFGAESDWLH
uniref:Uncharacterized protein n=1 Tax=Sinocyclocheilus rhinocerous TaxID=307959 RepID=A0A673NF07_9TELE